MNEVCEICSRKEGSRVDRCGAEDGIPLGPMECCELCGRLACPDCLHEADGCFLEADNRTDDPAWAPPGWRRRPQTQQRKEWEKIG